MISRELARGLAFTAGTSWRNYRALYSPKVLALSTLPRSVLQVAFFAYLGRVTGGADGGTFAFVGACVHIVVLGTVIKASDVLVDERQLGTLHRARLGVVPLPLLIAARWLVYVAEGVLSALAAIVLAGLLLDEWGTAKALLAATGLIVLVALTTSAFGMTLAAAATAGRTDVMWTNLGSYGLLVCCGVIAPVRSLGWFGDTIAQLLPLTHGLAAVRAWLTDQPWLSDAVAELAVGAGWLLVALALLAMQDRRARRLGTDDIF